GPQRNCSRIRKKSAPRPTFAANSADSRHPQGRKIRLAEARDSTKTETHRARRAVLHSGLLHEWSLLARFFPQTQYVPRRRPAAVASATPVLAQTVADLPDTPLAPAEPPS